MARVFPSTFVPPNLKDISVDRRPGTLAGLHCDSTNSLGILPAALLRHTVACCEFQGSMAFGCTDTREIKWVAADSSSAVGKAFETAGRHLCGDGEAFGRIRFADGAECSDFLGLGLGVIW